MVEAAEMVRRGALQIAVARADDLSVKMVRRGALQMWCSWLVRSLRPTAMHDNGKSTAHTATNHSLRLHRESSYLA